MKLVQAYFHGIDCFSTKKTIVFRESSTKQDERHLRQIESLVPTVLFEGANHNKMRGLCEGANHNNMARRVLEEMTVFGERPAPRSGHTCCATANHLLVYGGYDKEKDDKVYCEILSFNTISREWTELPHSRDVRLESTSSSMVIFGDNLIIFGGSGFPFGYVNTDDLSIFSLRTGKWCKLKNTKGDSPLPKYGQSMVVSPHNNKPQLYIFSGTIGREFLDELHCFDLESNSWHNIWDTDAPEARYRHEAVVYGNDFYVFGGATYHRAIDFRDIWKFNFTSHKWAKLECKSASDGSEDEFPSPRKSHSCVIWNSTVYMCGGIGDSLETFNDIWEIDLNNLVWRKLDTVLPTQVYFHSAAVAPDGCMYVFGGVDSSGKRLSSIYEIWLTVPSLLKISFSFVLDQLGENCDHYSVLTSLGLPKPLLDNALRKSPVSGN